MLFNGVIAANVMKSWTVEAASMPDGSQVELAGWVWDVREVGKIRFIILKDREGSIQVTVKKGDAPQGVWDAAAGLVKEDVILVKGVVKASRIARSGVEVMPSELRVLNRSKPLPIDIWGNVAQTELDARLRYRTVDLKRPESLVIFKASSAAVRAIRESLYDRGFIEVFTPKIISTSTEGGADLFPVQYFDAVAYLAQSPQLYKEELTASLERVFEVGPAYRAEKHSTTYHLNEFISVDLEAAFMNYRDVMSILEDVIINVYSNALKVPGVTDMNREISVPKKPFAVVSYDDALDMLGRKGINVKWGDDIPKEGLEALTGEIGSPFFLVNFPTSLRAFYTMPIEGDPSRSESFDLVIDGVEIVSGATRIHDRKLLENALISRGLNPANFESHLAAYEWGMPPHAGWGLGFYRLLMVMLRRSNIREVVLFPRDRNRLTP